MQLIGEHTGFPSLNQNGVQSTAFQSTFPRSFRFVESASVSTHCSDLRHEALAFNIIVTALLFFGFTAYTPCCKLRSCCDIYIGHPKCIGIAILVHSVHRRSIALFSAFVSDRFYTI